MTRSSLQEARPPFLLRELKRLEVEVSEEARKFLLQPSSPSVDYRTLNPVGNTRGLSG